MGDTGEPGLGVGPSERAALVRPGSRGVRRPAAANARGEPQIWLLGAALVACVVLITGLVGMILWQGGRTFWPGAIDRVTLRSGEVFLGVRVREEEAQGGRRLYRVGNRDAGREPFRWVDLSDVVSVEQPTDAVLAERQEWGVWLGVPKGIRRGGESVAEGVEETLIALPALHREAVARRERMERIRKHDLGGVNTRMEATRLSVRRAELDAERAAKRPGHLGWVAWGGMLAAAVALAVGGVRMMRSRGVGEAWWMSAARVAVWGLAVLAMLGVVLESPRAGPRGSREDVAAARERAEIALRGLEDEYKALIETVGAIDREDERYRVVLEEAGTGRVAPARRDTPEDPMRLSSLVRVVRPNEMSWWGKLGVYVSRWREFLADDPREANTEGGVFPVIVGTVLLTLLLSVVVVPLGVIAALYLREYARQGLLVSLIRISINNLAGVPSIVYGVFGLGFFCYSMGGFLDGGASAAGPGMARWVWWVVGGLVLALVAGAALLAARARPSVQSGGSRSGLKLTAGVVWILAAGGVVLLVARSPYFAGLHPEKLPSPTFGGPGLLWASLTLALLTLPVVIVSAEEALSAVPRSVREGSYGCGASQWQTLRRIVLPQALPGIMTGAILAMARGAGEVAPLMLVGAMKLAPELPVSLDPPFVHPERRFMHLGFHIYDLGFQSPDSEAARPQVWTTTLVLVLIVAALNLSAILIRNSLRSRARGAVV